jgi:hypothetical protein
MRKPWAILAIVALWIALIYVGFDYFDKKDQLPPAPLPDLSDQRQAGTVTRVSGSVFTRMVLPEDFQNMAISPKPKPGDPAWRNATQNASFVIGTLFRASAGGKLQVSTSGTWIVGLDGEGEFIFEDARTNEDRSLHTITWILKKGLLRAKPHTYDLTDHWLEVKTPLARVLVEKGELGIRLPDFQKSPAPDAPRGQVWLMSGKATVYWNDGRKKELPLKGMEYL